MIHIKKQVCQALLTRSKNYIQNNYIPECVLLNSNEKYEYFTLHSMHNFLAETILHLVNFCESYTKILGQNKLTRVENPIKYLTSQFTV